MQNNDLEVLREAGWSPASLAAALQLSPAKPNPIVFELSHLAAEVVSPSQKKSDASTKPSIFESPIQLLVRTFGMRRFSLDPDNGTTTPQAQQMDKKTTPSPSRFMDLTKDEEEVPISKVPLKSAFQSAKQLLSSAPAPTTSTTKTLPYTTNKENVLNSSSTCLKSDVIPFDKKELDSSLPNGWTLFQHQKEAIQQAVLNRRSILAYDMGLGKTIISIYWAKILCTHYTSCIALVIAPVTLLETWRREASMMGFNVASEVNSRIVKHAKDAPLLILASWSKIPTPAELLTLGSCFLIIGDESHAMQSLTSQRTQASLALCQHKGCVGTILATGTPMKNGKPCNILPLLIAIQHPIARNRIEFEKRYCNARKTKFCAWDTSGAANLEELRTLVGHFLMRKTKDECLDLPPLLREKLNVSPSPEHIASYAAIVKSIRSSSVKRGKQVPNAELPNPLELLTELRLLVSKAKVAPLAEEIHRLLSEDPSPIVVFVNFRESAFTLKDLLCGVTCEHLTGDIIKHSERQKLVDNFQAGLIDVLVCTFGVGSVGLTLTRSHRVVLMDRPWTPGDVMQAEDRVRRIGQLSPEINSYWVVGFDFDKKLDLVLEQKDSNSHKVLSSELKSSWFTNAEAATHLTSSQVADIRAYMKQIPGESKYPAVSPTSMVDPWNVRREIEDNKEAIGSSVMKDVWKLISS